MTPRNCIAALFLASTTLLASCKSSRPAPEATQDEAATPGASNPSAPPPAPKPLSFTGTYEAAPATMFIPREGDVPNAIEWAGTKFRSDDAGVGRGAGTLKLAVDDSGRVHGEGAGSLGTFSVSGVKNGDRIAATFRGAGADALFGTFDVTVRGTEAKGEGRASDGNAYVVRSIAIVMKAD